MIEETPQKHLMNSKSEWGNNSVPRVVVEQDGDRDRSGIKRIPDSTGNRTDVATAKEGELATQRTV